MEQREEGGNNGFVWQLPTRMKYSNIKLTRPVGRDTAKVTAWFASMATGVKRQTATIAAHDRRRRRSSPAGACDGVIPVRWTGPQLNLDSPKVATETLEIAHHGFLPPRGRPDDHAIALTSAGRRHAGADRRRRERKPARPRPSWRRPR